MSSCGELQQKTGIQNIPRLVGLYSGCSESKASYFHGNHNRYKEYKNSIWQSRFLATTLFFNIATAIRYTYFFSQQRTRACLPFLQTSVPAKVTHYHCCHCCNAPPTSPCAHIHCLVSINLQRALINVNGHHFFLVEELSCTSLLHPHFCVRHHFVRLLLCCHLSHSQVQPLLTIPPPSASDVLGQHHKTGGITFRAALVQS